VLDGSNVRLPLDTLELSLKDRLRAASLTDEIVEANLQSWRLDAMVHSRAFLQAIENKLRAAMHNGLAIVSGGIYDESEHTEGTGFRVRVRAEDAVRDRAGTPHCGSCTSAPRNRSLRGAPRFR
jgi:hypothetical protein